MLAFLNGFKSVREVLKILALFPGEMAHRKNPFYNLLLFILKLIFLHLNVNNIK